MGVGLIIIDIQNDYFPQGNMELEGSLEASVVASRLLNSFRSRELPVFHIQHIALQPQATFFLPDTEGVKIHDSVTPAENEVVIRKNFPNSFRSTTLLDSLRARNITKLVIAGMMTHMCVDATTRAAADFGYECLIASDACATRRLQLEGREVAAADVQTAFLAALNGVYGKVQQAEIILNKLAALV